MMKKALSALKIFLAVALVFALAMIYRQEKADKENLASLADAVRIAGASQRDEDTHRESSRRKPSGEKDSGGIRRLLAEQLPEEAAGLADIRLEALQEVNDEVAGWIEIPGTEVSAPVMRGGDNQFYLTHDWRKKENTAGAIFLECENDPSLNSFHTIIYGHRMRSGTMFGSLKYYKNPEYWQEHPAVYVAIESGIYRYDIFAAYEAGLEDLVYRLNLSGREERFIRYCLENSVLDTGIVPGASDRILTMSTCTSNNHSRRWVVQGCLEEIYE